MALLLFGQVHSVELIIDSNGILLGASNVNAAGSLYDVKWSVTNENETHWSPTDRRLQFLHSRGLRLQRCGHKKPMSGIFIADLTLRERAKFLAYNCIGWLTRIGTDSDEFRMRFRHDDFNGSGVSRVVRVDIQAMTSIFQFLPDSPFNSTLEAYYGGIMRKS